MPITLERTAEVAQKYVEVCPTIILGSGASIPHGLPSMPDLANELNKRIADKVHGTDRILWKRFEVQLSESKDLEKALHDIDLTPSLLSLLVYETWMIIAERELHVRDKLLANNLILPLTRLFRHLLRTAQASISVVTTNYDRLAEYAANAAEAVYFTGFTSGLTGGFVPDFSFERCSRRCPGSQGHVLLWKVHGSLDWFENSNNEPITVQGTLTIPSSFRPLIVTPGLTKYRETHRDPFRTVIAQADITLGRSKSYLCIGYGFNDEHIQPKLLSRLSKNDAAIVVITKKLTSAGKRFLLQKPCKKFLVLEEAAGGTMVYHPDAIEGEVLAGRSLWSLPDFLNMVIGNSDKGEST